MRRLLAFLPSLVIGVVGAAWLLVRGGRYAPRLGPGWQVVAGLGAALTLLALAWALERGVPSFRFASRLMADALRALELPPWALPALAAATAGGEELFFRGALLPVMGVLGQALLFGAFHPVPPRGWAYPAFAALAGLLLGWLTVASGSLLPAATAHFLINLEGFLDAGRRPARGGGRAPDAAAPAADEAQAGRGPSQPNPSQPNQPQPNQPQASEPESSEPESSEPPRDAGT